MRPVARIESMSPENFLELFQGDDGDIGIKIVDFEKKAIASLEFCAPSGSCNSYHTRKALIALMEAMERDNKERPELNPSPPEDE